MRFVKNPGYGCGVASLAMVAGTTYRAALDAVAAAGAKPHRGLHVREVVAGALHLGLVLEGTRVRPVQVALSVDRAILGVNWRRPFKLEGAMVTGHWVAVECGMVYDPDKPMDALLPVDAYLARWAARAGTVLVPVARVAPGSVRVC